MVEIMKKKYDQDLFLNLWCDPLGYFAEDELNPRVRCAFGNVSYIKVEQKALTSNYASKFTISQNECFKRMYKRWASWKTCDQSIFQNTY